MNRPWLKWRTDVSFVRLVSSSLMVLAVAMTAACVVRAGGEISSQGTPGMELDVDRPGSDFNNFDLSSASPEQCRDACAVDGRCAAYTYVRPGVQGPNARCWLKSAVPNAVANACCVSGVKGAVAVQAPPPPPPPPPPPAPPPPAPAPAVLVAPTVRGTAAAPPAPPPVVYQPVPGGGPLEHNIDRPGQDIQNFDLAQAEPYLCQRACMDNPGCRAFTYVRPGFQGGKPRCWLKAAVPNAVANACCVSGVKPGAPVPPPPRNDRDRHDDRDRHGDRDRDGRHDHRDDRHDHRDRRDARLEHNVDRPGNDIQNFDLPRPEPELCERACAGNPGCRAFTFVRPGVQGPNPRCWLKNAVPAAVPNGCCISGVR